MAETLIVVRDPDHDNEYVHLGDTPPTIITIDLGRAFDGRPEDQEGFGEFALGVMRDARASRDPQAFLWCLGRLAQLAETWGYDFPGRSAFLAEAMAMERDGAEHD